MSRDDSCVVWHSLLRSPASLVKALVRIVGKAGEDIDGFPFAYAMDRPSGDGLTRAGIKSKHVILHAIQGEGFHG